MSYAIVNFSEAAEVAVVPRSWVETKLNKSLDYEDVCWWPPKRLYCKNLIVTKAEPDKKMWQTFKVSVLEWLDDLSLAEKKIKEISDKDSDISDEEVSSKGRRRKPNRKLQSSSDDDGDDESGNDENRKKAPKKGAAMVAKKSKVITKKTPAPMAPAPVISLASTSDNFDSQENHTEIQNLPGPSSSYEVTHRDPSSDDSNRKQGPPPAGVIKKTDFFIKQNMEIRQQLSELSQHNARIENLLKNNNTTNRPELFNELNGLLPLKDYEALDKIEAELRNEEKRETLLTILSRIGGGTVTGVTTGIMSRVFADSLGQKITLCGTKEKRRLNDSSLYKVIIAAALKNSPSSTETQINAVMGNWFRNAKPRGERRSNKPGAGA